MLTLAEGLLAAPAQAGTPPVISVATAQDVSPLGLAWRGPPGLPSVSLSESEVPHMASCPLRFVLGLESTTRIPKLGELGHQRCTSSFRCAVQPGASVTRGKGLGGRVRKC